MCHGAAVTLMRWDERGREPVMTRQEERGVLRALRKYRPEIFGNDL